MKKTSSKITLSVIASLAVAVSSPSSFADDKDQLGKPAQDTGQNTTDTQNRNLKPDRATADPSARPSSGAQAMTPSSEFVKKAAECGAMEVKMGRLAVERAQNPAVKQFGQTLVNDHSKANQQLLQLAARKGVMLTPELQQELSQTDAALTAAGKTARTAEQDLTSNRQQVRDKARPTENTGENAAGVRDTIDSGKSVEHKGDAHASAARKAHNDHKMAMEKLKNLSGSEFDKAFIEHAVQSHQKAVQEFEKASQTLDDAEIKQFAASTLPTLKQHLQQSQSLAGKSGAPRTGLDRDYKSDTKTDTTKPD